MLRQVGFLEPASLLHGIESRTDEHGRLRVRFDRGWVTVCIPGKVFATQVSCSSTLAVVLHPVHRTKRVA